MRAIVYTAPRTFALVEQPPLSPGPDQVVVRPTMTGVCGTDLHLHDGGFFGAYPLTPGHEIVGEVEACGPEVTGLRLGQPVVVDNASACGRCPQCGRGEPLFCRNFCSLGVNAPGGFAEQLLTRADKVFPIGSLPRHVAVLAEPLACAVHGMDVLALRPGADVVMVGAGPTGLLLAQLLVHGGASRVVVAGPTRFKLELASSLGVDAVVPISRDDLPAAMQSLKDLAPHGYDVAIDATGAATVVQNLPDLVRANGTVLIYGMCHEEARVSWKPYDIFRRQLHIKGSFAQVNCFDRALAMLQQGRVRGEGIVTHRFPLAEYGQALEALRADPACLKAAILPNEQPAIRERR